MGAVSWTVYAPTRRKRGFRLPHGLTWQRVELVVKRLQMRIAKAVKEGKRRKAQAIQWLLAHSRCAMLLAIRRVTSNRGKHTPGVDGVVWRTSRQKLRAVTLLRRRGYRAQPLRRVYIPKKSGKRRPLGIPTMRDRAMQALYALTLEPIAETFGDPNSYGFRAGRCCADAVRQGFNMLCQKQSGEWVLECDIKSCFDEISHQWLLDNIPLDRRVLRQWLCAGFMENGRLYPTLKGTPQGGVISPLLMNMTLDGLEQTVRRSVPCRLPGTRRSNGVCVIRYADDFVITCKSREMLEHKIRPVVEGFLSERGLRLSQEKTRIVRIQEGFDFLGQHLRKYGDGIVRVKPSRQSVRNLMDALRQTLASHRGDSVWGLIRHLNQQLRGWCNYHHNACSKRIFGWLDTWLFWEIKRWLRSRHPNKGRRWVLRRYYTRHTWVFHETKCNARGKPETRSLLRAVRTPIVRHIKIRSDANPFDPRLVDYFVKRRCRRRDLRKVLCGGAPGGSRT